MFNAVWHDPKSKKRLPKKPECSKAFKRLKDVIEFSRSVPGKTFYVNWQVGNTGHLVRDGEKIYTSKIEAPNA